MRSSWLLPIALALIPSTLLFSTAQDNAPDTPDVIVVGAGISGLSAALEAARGGARVTVVDMWSIFGGHAVMSGGGLCIVDTPLQRSEDVVDSHELAEKDFMEWGEDADADWVSYYVRNSREQIYDWLEPMGVTYGGVFQPAGNSVPRFHQVDGRGLGLVTPIYRQCLLNPNISFRWNFRVTGLLQDGERVTGVRGESLRNRELEELQARHVILATGGFQSNLEMVREFWPEDLPFPDKFLIGSGLNSTGSGHEVAQNVGATLHRMDHQWNYATGLPHPEYPGEGRGLNSSNPASIWVNAQAKRFVNETGSTKERFPALVRQDPPMYWMIFDEKGKDQLGVSGSGWDDRARIERVIFGNEDLVHSASTIEALARELGLDPKTLAQTVARYNGMIDKGKDEDFARFGAIGDPDDLLGGRRRGRPSKIDEPPFFAIQYFPLTRKSMGGVAIDRSARVMDKKGSLIPGLYAVGELTGFGGVNGWGGLEGTFLGPSIVTGRVAGRTVLTAVGKALPSSVTTKIPSIAPSAKMAEVEQCKTCHDLETLVKEEQRGYAHFERVHRVVLGEAINCGQCHAELSPFDSETHRINRMAQTNNCTFCHVAQEQIAGAN